MTGPDAVDDQPCTRCVIVPTPGGHCLCRPTLNQEEE